MSTTTDYNSWQVEDVYVTPKGAKICRISDLGGSECTWKPEPHMLAPFGPSSFDKDPKAKRQNLDLVLADPAVREQVAALDLWALGYITAHSERLLKKPMTEEQVKSGYSSCMRDTKDPRFPPMLKCKIDNEGKHKLCLWDVEGNAAELPTNWREVELKVLVRVSHLWIMGAAFGLVLQITDAQVFPKEGVEAGPRENPFK